MMGPMEIQARMHKSCRFKPTLMSQKPSLICIAAL